MEEENIILSKIVSKFLVLETTFASDYVKCWNSIKVYRATSVFPVLGWYNRLTSTALYEF